MPSQASRSDQVTMPGCEARLGDALQRRADAPLRPSKPQQPIETGLFGDSHKQGELKL